MPEKKTSSKKTETKGSSKSKNKLIALGIIAVIIAAAVYFIQRSDNTVDTAYPSIDDIPCETQEYLNFHIHAHLDVFVDGQHLTVPQFVGIMNNSCLYWLHTHDDTGIIHMEAPEPQNFTLGEFIDVWRGTNTGAPPTGEPIIFVNGQEVATTLATTRLDAHDEIAIVYGQTPPNIPSFYQFPEGL